VFHDLINIFIDVPSEFDDAKPSAHTRPVERSAGFLAERDLSGS